MKNSLFLFFLIWYRKIISLKFLNKTPKDVFTQKYKHNLWKSEESISGTGSEIRQTELLITELNNLLKKLEVTSLLDIPCGDFNWMQKVELSNINYIGADIVEELILKNRLKFGETKNRKFQVINLITDPLPKADMVLVRDCLVHLSFKDIQKALNNIQLSGAKYLLLTTFTNHTKNFDIVTGAWRPLNFQKRPFNFPKPLLVINEKCTENNGKFEDKSLALCEIK